MEDVSKLPKWARFKLEKLEADVKFYHQRLAELGGDAETNTFMGYENRQPLPKNETIFFYVGDSYVSVRVNGSYIELRGAENITISPRASNSVEIRFERGA